MTDVVVCHVTLGGCQKGGWEGGCACLPGLGMILSPSSLPAINQVCMLGTGDVALWHHSCGVVGGHSVAAARLAANRLAEMAAFAGSGLWLFES